jgi:hypothetical protein
LHSSALPPTRPLSATSCLVPTNLAVFSHALLFTRLNSRRISAVLVLLELRNHRELAGGFGDTRRDARAITGMLPGFPRSRDSIVGLIFMRHLMMAVCFRNIHDL